MTCLHWLIVITFYASCERVFNPNLQGKPLAILSNNDGCVITSDEAKSLGLLWEPQHSSIKLF